MIRHPVPQFLSYSKLIPVIRTITGLLSLSVLRSWILLAYSLKILLQDAVPRNYDLALPPFTSTESVDGCAYAEFEWTLQWKNSTGDMHNVCPADLWAVEDFSTSL